MTPQFSIELVSDPTARQECIDLRDLLYQRHLGMRPSDWGAAESERDRVGWTFLLRDEGSPVGCGRVLPARSRMGELQCFARLPRWATIDKSLCEVGRIACKPRAELPPFSLLLLGGGARWLLEYTRFDRYIAYCRPTVAKAYMYVGAVDTGERFSLEERGGTEYMIVIGRLEDAVKALNKFPSGEELLNQQESSLMSTDVA
jgi:hypothetical protein